MTAEHTYGALNPASTSIYDVSVYAGTTEASAAALRAAFAGNSSGGVNNGRLLAISDLCFATGDNDYLRGRGGGDALVGLGGDDRLAGGEDADKLYGGTGDDLLIGGADDDRLEGGAGFDRLIGGDGADTFVFARPTDDDGNVRPGADPDRDTVIDFVQGEDRFDVSGWSTDFTFVGAAAFGGTGAAELRVVDNGGRTVVVGDADGDGTADFSFRLTQQITLTAADFGLAAPGAGGGHLIPLHGAPDMLAQHVHLV